MAQRNKNILVVDDEQETVRQIEHALAIHFNCVLLAGPFDCIIDVAYNGKEALDKMKKNETYDLLILDILVPKLNGIEVCQAMFEDERLKKTPTLLISILPLNSDDFKRSLEKFEELAMVRDVLEKPFSDEDLLAKIRKIITLVERL